MNDNDFDAGCESSNTAWKVGIAIAGGGLLALAGLGYLIYRAVS